MALQEAKQAISEEIDHLREQITRLEKALGHLDGKGQTRNATRFEQTPPAKGQRKRSSNKRKHQGARKRIAANERQEQILSIVKLRPGISQGDLAKEAGLTASYVGGIVKTLEGEQKLRRADGGVLAS